jgi:hypothetical protein
VTPVEFFEAHGSFCRTGNGTTFAVEAFHRDPEQLRILQEAWGGHIYPPPPAAPSRWTWRVYGAAARELWAVLRPQVSEAKRARGDRKLAHCAERFSR